MIKVKIKELGNHYYDLESVNERAVLYNDIETLEDRFNYTVVDLKTTDNWARFDEFTNIDDVIEVYAKLNQLTQDEYQDFLKYNQENIDEPLDIINNIIEGRV